jgi:hypothetical protein
MGEHMRTNVARNDCISWNVRGTPRRGPVLHLRLLSRRRVLAISRAAGHLSRAAHGMVSHMVSPSATFEQCRQCIQYTKELLTIRTAHATGQVPLGQQRLHNSETESLGTHNTTFN